MENDKKNSAAIWNWPVDDRPREKMLFKGATALSNSELIAILINNGNKEKSAVELAKQVMKLGKNNLDELGKVSLKELQTIRGIGKAKAITIAAALEIARRRASSGLYQKTTVRTSSDIANFLRANLKDLFHEVFGVGWERTVGVRQAAGTRTIPMAGGGRGGTSGHDAAGAIDAFAERNGLDESEYARVGTGDKVRKKRGGI